MTSLVGTLIKIAIAALIFYAALAMGSNNAHSATTKLCPPFCLKAGQVLKPAPHLTPWPRGVFVA